MAERKIKVQDGESFDDVLQKHFIGHRLESVLCRDNPENPRLGAEACLVIQFENGKSLRIPLGEDEHFSVLEVLPN